MSVKIIEEPDLYLTQDQYNRYMDEYRQAYMFYSGIPPTFESFVRMKQHNGLVTAPTVDGGT